MDKDYYKILGICESESAENIKAAYRKLARKWHPDIAGNDADILKKFKEINEAYDVLSNITKKAEYDKARRFYEYAKNGTQHKSDSNNQQNPNSATSQKNEGNSDNAKQKSDFAFDWKSIFSSKDKPKKQKGIPQNGDDIYTDVEISILDAIQGTEKVINVLMTEVCPKCGGRKFVNNSFCDNCGGVGTVTHHKRITVKIPAGIKNGAKIRLAGEGTRGKFGGNNGNLYIKICIKDSENFTTDGLNIHNKVYISPVEAILGGDINISTVNGDFSIKLAPYTQNGQKLRLTGCGIVQNDKVGDMIITVEIKIPKVLTNDELELYRKLASISTGNVKEDIYGRSSKD